MNGLGGPLPDESINLNGLNMDGAHRLAKKANEYLKVPEKGFLIVTIANNILTPKVFENSVEGWFKYAISYIGSLFSKGEQTYTQYDAVQKIVDIADRVLGFTSEDKAPGKTDPNKPFTTNPQDSNWRTLTQTIWTSPLEFGEPLRERWMLRQLKRSATTTIDKSYNTQLKAAASDGIKGVCIDAQEKLQKALASGSPQKMSEAYEQAYLIWEKFGSPESEWKTLYDKIDAGDAKYPTDRLTSLKESLIRAKDTILAEPRTTLLSKKNRTTSDLPDLKNNAKALLDAPKKEGSILASEKFKTIERLVAFTSNLMSYCVEAFAGDESSAHTAYKNIKAGEGDIGKTKWSDWKERSDAFSDKEPGKLDAIKAKEKSDFKAITERLNTEIQSLDKLSAELNAIDTDPAVSDASVSAALEQKKKLLNGKTTHADRLQLQREVKLLKLVHEKKVSLKQLKEQIGEVRNLFKASLPVIAILMENGLPSPQGKTKIQAQLNVAKEEHQKIVQALSTQKPISPSELRSSLAAIHAQLAQVPGGFG